MSRINKSVPQQDYARMDQPVKQNMNLKVLYTLEDESTYLGRSAKPLMVKVVNIPGSPIRLGAVDLKKCLQIVLQSSPELVRDDCDFSCYSKDISEPDEPYVGHGMISTLSNKKGENLVPGRVCTSFASLLGGSNSNETLEVKLKLLRVYKYSRDQKPSDYDQSSQGNEQELEEFVAPQGKYYKRAMNNGPHGNHNSIPVKASRTKSLPVAYNNNALPPQRRTSRGGATLSQRMNSIASSKVTSSPVASASDVFPEPKRFKVDNGDGAKQNDTKKKLSCLECGTNQSKTWKVVKTPLKQLDYKTGVLCNTCNASMLRSNISTMSRPYAPSTTKSAQHFAHPQQQQQQNSSSPAIPSLSNVDINEIFSVEYDVSRFGGPLTDIDPLPQQATPVDEPSRATRLNTTLIDMDEDKENVQPSSKSNSPRDGHDKPISVSNVGKPTEFERLLAESFHEFSALKPDLAGDSPSSGKKSGWANVLFAHAEEDEHKVQQDTEYSHKKASAKTPCDEAPKTKGVIASSPPMYSVTPYKDEESSLDKMHSSILTSINDDINSLAHWDHNGKISPPTSFLGDDDDGEMTEDEK